MRIDLSCRETAAGSVQEGRFHMDDKKIAYALDAAQWALVQHLIQSQIRDFSSMAGRAQRENDEKLYYIASEVAAMYISIDDEITRQRLERR